MTRLTASAMTDDALDALYAERNAFAAAVAAVSVKAHEWADLAPSDDWGLTPRDTTLADAGRYLISLMATSAPVPPAAAPVARGEHRTATESPETRSDISAPTGTGPRKPLRAPLAAE